MLFYFTSGLSFLCFHRRINAQRPVISRKVLESVMTYVQAVKLLSSARASDYNCLKKIFKTLGKVETNLLSKVCQFAKFLLSHAADKDRNIVFSAWAQFLCMKSDYYLLIIRILCLRVERAFILDLLG